MAIEIADRRTVQLIARAGGGRRPATNPDASVACPKPAFGTMLLLAADRNILIDLRPTVGTPPARNN